MKKAIVTGANGFFGRWLINELIEQGVSVIAVVRSIDSVTCDLYSKNVRFIICPLADIRKLSSIIEDRDIDVFYHLAWAGTSGANRADVKIQLENIQATCDAIKSAYDIKCSKFVNAGSIMEYEAMQYIKKDGATPGMGNIYSIAKQAADFMAKTLAVNMNISYISAIISNIYGEGETSARFINSTLKKFLLHEKTSFTHGKQLYDFIYAKDAARAFYLIGNQGKSYNSYYIGNPVQFPLKDYILQMKNIVDKSITIKFGEIPFQGVSLDYSDFDTMKMKKEFEFEPKVSFDQGIKATVKWIQLNDIDCRK